MQFHLTALLRYSAPALAMFTAVALVIGTLVPLGHGGAALAEGKKLSAVYVYDRDNVVYRDEDAPAIDQLFFSFALFKKGHVSGDHWEGITQYQSFVEKHPNILPILSVGGWGADGFSQAAATLEGRTAFVEDVLALMQAYGFRGVDIDWEYPGSSVAGIQSSPDDRENFTLLLAAMRNGLDSLTVQDGVPRRLCIAVSGDPSSVNIIECGKVGAIVDQVNLMTYDMQDNHVATHHAPLYAPDGEAALSADACVRAYIQAGIPANKLMLGVAFFGHRWKVTGDTPLNHRAKKAGTVTYTEIARLIAKKPDAVYYDETAQAPYYYNGKIFISYDDERSIAQKGLYVAQHGLMGLFSWEYGSDTTGRLLQAMRQ